MATFRTSHAKEYFEVVHPLYDAPEVKRSAEGLEPIRMSWTVRLALLALWVYLVSMSLLLLCHVLDLAGLFSFAKA